MILVARRNLLSAASCNKERIIELADAIADIAPDACGTLVFEFAVVLDFIVKQVAVVVEIPSSLGIDRSGGIEVFPVDKQCLAMYLGCQLRTRFLRDCTVVFRDLVCAVEIMVGVVLDVGLEVDRGRGVLHKGCTRFLRDANLSEVVSRRIDEVTVRGGTVRIRRGGDRALCELCTWRAKRIGVEQEARQCRSAIVVIA